MLKDILIVATVLSLASFAVSPAPMIKPTASFAAGKAAVTGGATAIVSASAELKRPSVK